MYLGQKVAHVQTIKKNNLKDRKKITFTCSKPAAVRQTYHPTAPFKKKPYKHTKYTNLATCSVDELSLISLDPVKTLQTCC